jgi:formyltetrahydrofolate synthetase
MVFHPACNHKIKFDSKKINSEILKKMDYSIFETSKRYILPQGHRVKKKGMHVRNGAGFLLEGEVPSS